MELPRPYRLSSARTSSWLAARRRVVRKVVHLLSAATVGAALVLGMHVPAAAATTVICQNPHCYLVGELDMVPGYNVMGDSMNIRVSCIALYDPYNDFVTAETWVRTDGYTGQYWVEAGLAYGYPVGPALYRYWADNRPNGGGYHEHDAQPNSASANSYYTVFIDQTGTGSTSWRVGVGSGFGGTSTYNPGPSTQLQVGTELDSAYSDRGNIRMDATAVAFYDSLNRPRLSWSYSKGTMYTFQEPSAYTQVASVAGQIVYTTFGANHLC